MCLTQLMLFIGVRNFSLVSHHGCSNPVYIHFWPKISDPGRFAPPRDPSDPATLPTLRAPLQQRSSRVGRGAEGRWSAPRAPRPERNQRPAPRAPERPAGLARAAQASPGSRSTGHPPDLFCPGLTRGLGCHARELRACAASRTCAASRAACLRTPHGAARSALVHIRALRLHAMLHTTPCGGITNDAFLVHIRELRSALEPPSCKIWCILSSSIRVRHVIC